MAKGFESVTTWAAGRYQVQIRVEGFRSIEHAMNFGLQGLDLALGRKNLVLLDEDGLELITVDNDHMAISRRSASATDAHPIKMRIEEFHAHAEFQDFELQEINVQAASGEKFNIS